MSCLDCDAIDAECILMKLRGRLLRLVSQHTGSQHQGLSVAARSLRRQKRISNSLAKKLSQLDECCAWLRHATRQKADHLVWEVVTSLDNQAASDTYVPVDTPSQQEFNQSFYTMACASSDGCTSVDDLVGAWTPMPVETLKLEAEVKAKAVKEKEFEQLDDNVASIAKIEAEAKVMKAAEAIALKEKEKEKMMEVYAAMKDTNAAMKKGFQEFARDRSSDGRDES